MYQILGYPEAIIYILLFIGLLNFSKKYGHKKIVTIMSIIIMALLSLMGIMGFIMA
jgi:N-acyl-L-homoserine lactone synthetase